MAIVLAGLAALAIVTLWPWTTALSVLRSVARPGQTLEIREQRLLAGIERLSAGAPRRALEERLAAIAREKEAWTRVLKAERGSGGSFDDRIGPLKGYLESFPEGVEVSNARARLSRWEDEARAFRATTAVEKDASATRSARLLRWQAYLRERTASIKRAYAQARVEYWAQQVRSYEGWAQLKLVSASGLPPSDDALTTGSREPDPYVRILQREKVVYQTRVLQDTATPAWGESVRIYVSPKLPVTAEVWDADLVGADLLLRLTIESFPVDGPFVVSRGGVSLRLEIHREG